MMEIRRYVSWACCLLFVWSSSAERLEGEAFEKLRLETFEAVWQQIADGYYDGSFRGLDWDAVGDRYRKKLHRIDNMDALRVHLESMLYELGDSHLAILTPSVSEDRPVWRGGDSGVEVGFAGKQIVARKVEPEGPAYAAGMRAGDLVLAVNGRTVSNIRRMYLKSRMPRHLVEFSVWQHVVAELGAPPGKTVSLRVKTPGKGKQELSFPLRVYDGSFTQTLGNLGPMPISFEGRQLSNGVGYLRFGLWFPAVMGDIRNLVTNLPEDTPGLIIDLRGNPGGVGLIASGLAGLLVDEQAALGTTRLREGHINFVGFPQKGAFLGPVAILVDETSLSTSEVFAIGLQEYGRARVFGQPTPGAALPSVVTKLPNGDFLQFALGDFRTPSGAELEGKGVVPDEIIPISPIDLSEGKDKVLEAALSWILTSNHH